MTTPAQPSQPAGDAERLLDDEGENRALRCFLMQYGVAGLTVGAMKTHLRRCGFPLWPAWAESQEGQHLTKAGAQLWIRHLLSLEAAPPTAPLVEEPMPPLPTPAHTHWVDDGIHGQLKEPTGGFTADQMREYALADRRQRAAPQDTAVALNIIRWWPDGFAERLEHVWRDLIGFIPNYKLYDLQRMLAEFGFTMVVYENATIEKEKKQ